MNDQGGLDATDITNMAFDRDEEGSLPPISAGGSYQTADSEGRPVTDSGGNPVTHGLTAGKTYKIGITAYKYVHADKDGDGQTDDTVYGIVYGNEVLSDGVLLKAACFAGDACGNAVPDFSGACRRGGERTGK